MFTPEETARAILATEWRFVGLNLDKPHGAGILLPPIAERRLIELARAYLALIGERAPAVSTVVQTS